MARAGKTIGAVLAVLLIVLVVALAVFDWNHLRGLVNAQVSDRIGREFAIRGDLDVDLSLIPHIRARDVIIANPDWASRPNFAEAAELELRVKLLPLLRGRVEVPLLGLTRPDVYLERAADGRNNWAFETEDDQGGGPPLGELRIREGILRYGDPEGQTALGFYIQTREPEAAGTEPSLAVKGEGMLRGGDVSLSLEGGSVLVLRDTDAPYPLAGEIRYGRQQASLRGSLAEPQRFGGADLQFTLEGPGLEDFQLLVPGELPELPPYSLQGRLRRDGPGWRLDDFEGRVGESRLAGSLSLETQTEPIRIAGSVRSDRLDMEDFSGLVGGEPGRGLLETARQRGRLLPEEPLALDALSGVDVDLTVVANRIVTERVDVDRLETQIRLEKGRLGLAPLEFAAAGGAFAGTVMIDTGHRPYGFAADIELQSLDLHELLPESDAVEPRGSQVGGQLELEARGDSPAALAASAVGELGVVVTRAEVSERLVNLAGQDILGTLASFFGTEDTIPLYCAVGAFTIEDGQMRADTLAMNTEDANFYGEGNIDLGREALDLTIYPEEEDPTLAIGAPLRVTGSLLEPDIALDEEAVVRGALALGLGAAAAPAGILPLVEPGEETAAGCRRLFQEAEKAGDDD